MPGGGGGGGIPALSAYAPNMLYCRLYLIYIYIHIQLQRHDCNTTPGQHLAVTVRTRILPNKDSAKGLSKGTLKQAWIANSRVSWRHWHPLHWIATWWTTRP